jgi:hypothetical protein
MDSGIFAFRIGSTGTMVDWVHADNLAQAFSLALLDLTEGSCKSAGNVYAISDGSPVDSFGFLAPLAAARHVPYPSVVIPVPVAIALAHFLELMHLAMRAVVGRLALAPLLTRAEVYKVGINHTLTIKEAQTDFGYKPTITTPEGSQRMADYYQLKPVCDGGDLKQNANYFSMTPIIPSAVVLSVMMTFAYFSYFGNSGVISDGARVCAPEGSAICTKTENILLSVCGSYHMIKNILHVTVAAHVFEAFLALRMARGLHVCWSRCVLWFVQVSVVGYPAWGKLRERHAFMNAPLRADKDKKKQK